VSRNLPGCTEENHKKPPVSRSEVLPDSKQKQTLVDRNFRAQRMVRWNLRVNFIHFVKMITEVRLTLSVFYERIMPYLRH
jgi:hypothetical protein